MRIRSLSLDFFGHFTDQTYDFGPRADGGDFHIIYGRNEAGKSTTMEAFLRLLYKFPARDPYDFRHQRKNLRVSGVMDIDGTSQAFTRLPTRGDNLLDGAGQPLPEHVLATQLGGLSLEDYRNLLCLDDETIESGGQEIANAKGDIGRLLFSAAAGIADLSGVLEQAQAQAKSLHLKNSKSSQMAVLKKELTEVDKQIRALDVTASAWRKMKQDLEQAEQAESDAKSRRDALRRRQSQLTAQHAALDLLTQHDALTSEIAPYADYPDHMDVSVDQIFALQTKQSKAQSDHDRITQELAEGQNALDALKFDPLHDSLLADLAALSDLQARMRTADLDLPRREHALSEITTDMTRLVADMGSDCDARDLVLPLHALAELERNRDDVRSAEHEVQTAQQEWADTKNALDQLPKDLAAHAALADILNQYDAAQLAQRHIQALEALRSAKDRRDSTRAALSVGPTRFDTLPASPIDAHRGEEIARRYDDLSRHAKSLQDDLREHRDTLGLLNAQITSQQTTANLPSDAETAEAHSKRNALWRDHLHSLSTASAASFETAMHALDHLAQARLNGASQLGQLRQLDQRRIELEVKVAQTDETLIKTNDQIAQLDAEIREITAGIGLPQTTASGLSAWLRTYQTACDAEADYLRVTAQHANTIETCKDLVTSLAPHLPEPALSFSATLKAAQQIVTTQASINERKDGLKSDLARRTTQLKSKQDQAQAAQTTWDTAIQQHVGTALSAAQLRQDLAPLRTLRELDGKRAQTQRQVDAMRSDQAQFTTEVSGLAHRHGIQDPDPRSAFDQLRAMADQAETARATQARLTQEQTQKQAALQTSQSHLEEVAQAQKMYATLFPDTASIDDLEMLRNAVSNAHSVIAKRGQCRILVGDILTKLDVPDLHKARTMLEECTRTDLEAELESLPQDLDQSEAAYHAAIATCASARTDLSNLSGDSEIAELVQRKATLELQIEDTALSYLRLSMGITLAEEAIRRYRDSHRNGMIRATQTAFSSLTNGAYPRLTTQTQGSSEVLLALDRDGVSKRVDDMSKGTRFQLYLALRAAAYEQMVASGVSLPFFCDDIFETFDEERTKSACLLMEQIGQQGQGIYLTHHRHVLDIAQAHCKTPPKIHVIGGTL